MTNSVSDFEQQLGRELREAAERRIDGRRTGLVARRGRGVGLAAAVVVAAAVFAWAVFALLGSGAAVAGPFRVVHLEDEIHLEIVDLVTDPGAAELQLEDELGISVEFSARPAPPELVGHVVAVAGTGTTTARVVFDDTGRSERIVLPRKIDGALTVYYGRNARAGERYHATVTSSVCIELWAMSPQQAQERLVGLADHIRYDMIDADYNHTSDVALADVDPAHDLIDVMFLSLDEILVVYSAHLDALGTERPQCGWSAASSD